MASQTLWCADFPTRYESAGGNTVLTIDAAGERAAFVGRVQKTGNIRKIHFRLGLVTTGQTLLVSLQDVDLTTGFPDGTADQSGTVAVADTDDNSWKTCTLSADRAVTLGDLLSIVIDWDSTAGNLIVLSNSQVIYGNYYSVLHTASWAIQARGPIVVLEMDDGSICPMYGGYPAVPASVDTGSGSTPDEIAMYFSVPFPCRCSSVNFFGRLAGDADAILYDSDGSTVLGSCSLDANLKTGTGDLSINGPFAPVALLANTAYRAAVKPTTATTMRLHYGDVSVAAHMAALPGGTGCHWSERSDGGAWSQTATRRPAIWVTLEAFDDGAGGGGGGVIGGPNKRAGMQ